MSVLREMSSTSVEQGDKNKMDIILDKQLLISSRFEKQSTRLI